MNVTLWIRSITFRPHKFSQVVCLTTIYATDSGIDESSDPGHVRQELHQIWLADWKYFATDDAMSVAEVNGEFQGLQLPREVIDKIYHDNAVRWFQVPDAW